VLAEIWECSTDETSQPQARVRNATRLWALSTGAVLGFKRLPKRAPACAKRSPGRPGRTYPNCKATTCPLPTWPSPHIWGSCASQSCGPRPSHPSLLPFLKSRKQGWVQAHR